MKAAFLLAESPALFDDVRSLMTAAGAQYSSEDGGIVQAKDSRGRFVTIYARVGSEFEWEVRSGPFEVVGSAQLPDMDTVTACVVECRWEDLFVETMRDIGAALSYRTWILDGNGVVWIPSELDANRVQL